MSRPLIPWKMLLTCSLLALVASTARPQEATGIRWRTDYATARKEAEAKNLPILIDFMRNDCPPCMRMESQTFTDPRIIQLIGQRFIPLKVNSTFDPSLANQLGIGAYPTLVTASSDGHVLKSKVGFQTGDELNEMMQQTLAMITPPDSMREKYLAAVKLESKGEFHLAIASLKDILDDTRPRPLLKDAQALMTKIEKRAADRLVEAKELHSKGKNEEAFNLCTEIIGTFPGVPASRDAKSFLPVVAASSSGGAVQQRSKRAADLFKQAEEFHKNKQYLACWDTCETIIEHYGDFPEGAKAIALTKEFCNDSDRLKNAAIVMTDRLSAIYLALADNSLKQSDVRQAQQYLQHVINTFPGSRAAESAQIRLNQLQGTVPAGSIMRK
jgi:thioredoxin-like negative regulator of GroEL